MSIILVNFGSNNGFWGDLIHNSTNQRNYYNKLWSYFVEKTAILNEQMLSDGRVR